jgi:hypothetical protein
MRYFNDARKLCSLTLRYVYRASSKILLPQRRNHQSRHANDISFAQTLQSTGHNIVHIYVLPALLLITGMSNLE